VTRSLRVHFSVPAYWPAHSFGGPIEVMRRLAEGLTSRGHALEVFTTSLTSLDAPGSMRSRVDFVDGVPVHYLATPLHFRWMGLTPTLPLHLERAPRPDVVHVFGFRDPIGTGVAAWCRARRIPYVFEFLGLVTPRERKVQLKRALDATFLRGVMPRAAAVVAASHVQQQEYLAAGVPEGHIVVRPHGFPEPFDAPPTGALHERLGIEDGKRVVLSVGRIAHGKGLELLVRAAADLPDVHFAFVGPDGGHGVLGELLGLRERLGVADRVHFLGILVRSELLSLFGEADAFVLPSSYESFGMVAAEAAAAGAPIVVTDRCGVAELFADRGALVVPYEEAAVRSALARLLEDEALCVRLGAEARSVAAEWSWSRILDIQEDLYNRVVGDA
jgi:glycosyltransferase involved in cell wall biosynthesis